MLKSLRIAWRFLIHSKIQTLLIILGISIGVSVQIFIGLLSQGLEGSLINKVVGSFVNITISSENDKIEDWQSKKDKINKLNVGATTIAPAADLNGFVQLNGKKQNVQVRGFYPADVNSIYSMESKVYEGKMINGSGQVLVGKDLKKRLGINVGDKIDILTFGGKKTEVTVVGFYDLGAIKINSVWIISDLATVQDAAGYGNSVTSMEISVKDAYNADVIANKINGYLGDKSLKIENWKDQNKLLASAMSGQKICSVIIQFFVLLAAVLSIISILGISVVQKYKQIGILKAMGFKDTSAAFVFLLEAFVLGIFGTAVGVELTMLYIKEFNRYIVAGNGKPIIDIVINHRFILKSVFVDIAASTLAALLPAVKSFKLNPVEVIKNA